VATDKIARNIAASGARLTWEAPRLLALDAGIEGVANTFVGAASDAPSFGGTGTSGGPAPT